MTAIEDGMYTLETRKAEIMAIMVSAEAPPVVRLHPNAAEVYRRKVAELELALNDDSIKAEAAEILRSLIDRIVLTPTADAMDGIGVQLHGDLAAVLALSAPDKQKLPAVGMAGSQLSVVAGERNQRYLQTLVSRIPMVNRPLTAVTGDRESPRGRQ